MNKNVFRAVKRDLKQIFKSYCRQHGLKMTRKKIDANTQLFSSHLLSEISIEIDPTTFHAYVDILLNYCRMKKKNSEPETKQKMVETYDVLYSYSHHKFYQFLGISEIKAIITNIIRRNGVDQFISHHPVLMKNRVKYTHVITQMLDA